MNECTSFIVYKHTSPSGKVYIGITQQSPSRRFGAGNGYIRNEYFWRAIEKYGWDNFKHEILYSGLSREMACTTEIELIAKYNSANRMYGYNISLGGDHQIVSEETCRKISESNKGKTLSEETRKKLRDAHANTSEETRKKISKALKGRIVSAETRRKKSDVLKGHVVSEETRKKMSEAQQKLQVMCIETGIVYASAKEAHRQTGIYSQSISAVCNNKLKTAGGLHWKFVE